MRRDLAGGRVLEVVDEHYLDASLLGGLDERQLVPAAAQHHQARHLCRSSNVSERNPNLSVSTAMLSSGATLPRFT